MNSSYAGDRAVGGKFVNDLPSVFFVVGRGVEVSMPSRGDGYEVGDMNAMVDEAGRVVDVARLSGPRETIAAGRKDEAEARMRSRPSLI